MHPPKWVAIAWSVSHVDVVLQMGHPRSDTARDRSTLTKLGLTATDEDHRRVLAVLAHLGQHGPHYTTSAQEAEPSRYDVATAVRGGVGCSPRLDHVATATTVLFSQTTGPRGTRRTRIGLSAPKASSGRGSIGSWDSSSMRYRCMALATTSSISVTANWLPMHRCGPAPKGKYALRSRFATSSAVKRSGRNSSGSSQNSGYRCAWYALKKISAPAGMRKPPISSSSIARRDPQPRLRVHPHRLVEHGAGVGQLAAVRERRRPAVQLVVDLTQRPLLVLGVLAEPEPGPGEYVSAGYRRRPQGRQRTNPARHLRCQVSGWPCSRAEWCEG